MLAVLFLVARLPHLGLPPVYLGVVHLYELGQMQKVVVFEVAEDLLDVFLGDGDLVPELEGQVGFLGDDLLKEFEIPPTEHGTLDLLKERVD